MKKLNNKGFVLAETLVVSLFVMIIFTMIYANYMPLIGEYEKRETYDNVDGKYTAFWIKRMIESPYYVLSSSNKASIETKGYFKFSCADMKEDFNQRNMCYNMIKNLDISGCDNDLNNCDIFVTYSTIGAPDGYTLSPNFKEKVNKNETNEFSSAFIEYVNSLPNYVNPPTGTGEGNTIKSGYRVFVSTKRSITLNDTNEYYYSFSNMEVYK